MFPIEPYKARLTADVFSSGKHLKKGEPEVYGKRFDTVLIVADHDNVLIAEATDKKRFAVLKNQIQVL